MNMDDLFDKMERNPVGFVVGMWIVGGIASLIGLVLAVVIIVAILNGFGVV